MFLYISYYHFLDFYYLYLNDAKSAKKPTKRILYQCGQTQNHDYGFEVA